MKGVDRVIAGAVNSSRHIRVPADGRRPRASAGWPRWYAPDLPDTKLWLIDTAAD